METSSIAAGLDRPRSRCHDELEADTASTQERKAGLPNREPAWSSGGLLSMRLSIASKVLSSLVMTGSIGACEMEEIFLFATESESEKTKEVTRSWVGDERNSS